MGFAKALQLMVVLSLVAVATIVYNELSEANQVKAAQKVLKREATKLKREKIKLQMELHKYNKQHPLVVGGDSSDNDGKEQQSGRTDSDGEANRARKRVRNNKRQRSSSSAAPPLAEPAASTPNNDDSVKSKKEALQQLMAAAGGTSEDVAAIALNTAEEDKKTTELTTTGNTGDEENVVVADEQQVPQQPSRPGRKKGENAKNSGHLSASKKKQLQDQFARIQADRERKRKKQQGGAVLPFGDEVGGRGGARRTFDPEEIERLKQTKREANFATFINKWFSKDAAACNTKNISAERHRLHACSGWEYMDKKAYDEMILGALSKLDPPLQDGERVLELGVGVGGPVATMVENWKNLSVHGTDFSSSAIDIAMLAFPEFKKNFHVADMTKHNTRYPSNKFDHVFSHGALGMYLAFDQMAFAVKEAVRMTKPGGSLLFTHLLMPGSTYRASIRDEVPPEYWASAADKLGVTNVVLSCLRHQGDRYMVSMTKKVDPLEPAQNPEPKWPDSVPLDEIEWQSTTPQAGKVLLHRDNTTGLVIGIGDCKGIHLCGCVKQPV